MWHVISLSMHITPAFASPPPEVGATKRAGAVTLEFVGKILEPEPPPLEADEFTEVQSETASLMPGGLADSVFDWRVSDRHGLWRVIDVDTDMVARSVADYDKSRHDDAGWQRLLDEQEAAMYNPPPEIETFAMMSSDWMVWDCDNSTKWEYLPATDLALSSGAVTPTERAAIGDGDAFVQQGSFVVVGPQLVLTTGHTVINGDGDPGTNSTICIKNTFNNNECRTAVASVENGDQTCSNDWELVLLNEPFDFVPQPFDLASGDDNYLEAQVPRHAGYPTLLLNQESTCTVSGHLQGERSTGSWDSITNQTVRLDISAGGNSSGGPYYFFNSTQGRYKAFGIHSKRLSPLGNRQTCGPKIPYWRSSIITAGGVLGGTF